MKKLVNFVKWSALAIALGETIASYYKDEKFRKNLETAKGFDKCRVIFNNLIDVNKKFFTEVKWIDFESTYNDAKSFIEDKIAKINLKADEILSHINEFNDWKIKPILKDLEKKSNDLKNQLKSQINDISEKVKLEEKVKMIESKIDQIKEKFSK
jgi:t-SNARE complex subunit (syntaxin)